MVEFLTTPSLPRGVALIEGKLPSRREWERIFREDLWVNVLRMPGTAVDLRRLRPYADRIRHLMVNSASCRDLRDVALMSELRSLAVGGLVDVGADLAVLASLETFGGPTEAFDGVLDHPNLTHLAITWNEPSRLEIAAPLTDLDVEGSRAVTRLPVLARPERLRRLAISGAGRLSLAGVRAFRGLEQIELSSCASLTDIGEILRLLALRSLALDSCPVIDDFSELSRLEGASVLVIGRNPFDRDFREEVTGRGSSQWVFPPGKRYLPES